MKAERFSLAVPQQEVMSLRGLSFLCVLMFPKATPGLALRIVSKDCSKDCFLNKRLKEYKGYLVDQGYPEELVSREFSRAASIPRNDLLQAKVRDSKKIFPFVLKYNPNLPSINGLIKKHFHFLL